MSAPKVALITGTTGQDGARLAEFLWGKGYVVHLHYDDLTDATNLILP